MKKLIALLLAILMTLSLCACGASKTADSPAYDAVSYNSAMKNESTAGGFATEAEMPVAAGAAEGGGDAAPELNPDKIIYSANATVETTEFENTCVAVEKLVKESGGWIESSSVNDANYFSKSSGADYNRSAQYQLRIPSDKFNGVMGELSNLGNVPYSNTYTENVTSQYYDVQARLTAYETQEARLLEMMEKAETVSDIITIEDRLTELRYQIESLQSTLNNWDRQVSYSSISLSVDEVRDYTPEAAGTYWKELWQSLVEGLEDALDFILVAIVFIVGALPVLIVLGLIAWGVIAIIKKINKAGKNREAKRAAAKEAKTEEKK